MVDISKINLNLLLALKALVEHAHVSRAADQLDVSQAAMSTSLKKLREILKDPLLVRGQQGQMTLTPLAETLKPKIRFAIQEIESIFTGHHAFTPEVSKKSFVIGMSDHIAYMLLPKLIPYLEKNAPNIQIIHYALNHLESQEILENAGIDIAIGNFPHAPDTLKTQSLFTDDAVIVASSHHPIFKKEKFTLKSLAAFSQIFVSLGGHPDKNFIYDIFRDTGLNPHVTLFTPQTLLPFYMLHKTKIITHTVSKLAEPHLKPLGLTMRAAPYAFTKYKAKQYWQLKMDNDPAHQWLRRTIKKLI